MPLEEIDGKFYELPDELLAPASEDTTTLAELQANNLAPAFEQAEKLERGEG